MDEIKARNFLKEVCKEFERKRAALSPLVKEVDSSTGAGVVTEDLEIRFDGLVHIKDNDVNVNERSRIKAIVGVLEDQMHEGLFNSFNKHVSNPTKSINLKCLACSDICQAESLIEIIPPGKVIVVTFGVNCFNGEEGKRLFIERVQNTQLEIIPLPLLSIAGSTMFIMSESDAPSLKLYGCKNESEVEKEKKSSSSGIWAAELSEDELTLKKWPQDLKQLVYNAKVYADMSLTWKTDAEVIRVNLTRAACQA